MAHAHLDAAEGSSGLIPGGEMPLVLQLSCAAASITPVNDK